MQGTGKANRIKFTKSELAKLVFPSDCSAKQIRIKDEVEPGLCLRLTRSGRKTFVYYRKPEGGRSPEERTLGDISKISIDEARKLTAKFNALLFEGKDLKAYQQEEQAEKVTFKQLFHKYIAEHAKLKRKSWKQDEEAFNRHFQEFASSPVHEITKQRIQKWVNRLSVTSGKATANRNLDRMKAVFKYAIKLDYFVGADPTYGVTGFKKVERDRFLQPGDEYERFMQALDKEPVPVVRDFFLMLLLTGARMEKVLSMRWQDIHFSLETWHTIDNKNGDNQDIPLSREAMKLLEKRKNSPDKNDVWVFPSPNKSRTTKGHLTSPKKRWRELLVRSGITNLTRHDLRRTAGSYLAISGASLPMIGSLLGHKSPASTKIYARLNIAPLREALEKSQAQLVKVGSYD